MLSPAQLTAFVRDGYVVVPDIVPEELLGPVDSEFSEIMGRQPPAAPDAPHHSAFVAPAKVPACVTAFDESPARAVAESLVDPHRLEHIFDHVQLCTNPPHHRHRPGSPHIDGMGHGPERPETFTMLAGIFLGDEQLPDHGNLYVWPGSHLLHASVHRRHGTDALLPTGGHIGLFDREIDVGPSHPVFAKRGDLLLSHYLTGHNSGGNETDTERRIVYFRLGTVGHRSRWEAAAVDPWHEYAAGVREVHDEMHSRRVTKGVGEPAPYSPPG